MLLPNKRLRRFFFKVQRHLILTTIQQSYHAIVGVGYTAPSGCWYRSSRCRPLQGCRIYDRRPPSFDGIHELVIDFRIKRIAKIETVGNTQRLTATADDIAGCFCYRDHSAFIGVGIDIPAVTVGRHRQCFVRSFSQHDRRVTGLIGRRVRRYRPYYRTGQIPIFWKRYSE